MHDYLCSVSLGLLYIFVVISARVCFFRFLSTSQEISWEERLRNDPFCVEWDINQSISWLSLLFIGRLRFI